ncbi:MAG: PEP/pyruvate-binding domain-containing protein, partial [Desulforhabdus sp.]|nr:PEP/pyruvate-binding domain-containing protein [Desulforhabdus sp.]
MDVEELRTTFKARYHHFKLLLNANNKALEMMTEMESALHGNRPFGMSFIRATCTAISANVFQIVKNLNELAPGSYDQLYDRFKEIQGEISRLLNAREQPRGDRLIIPLREIDRHMTDQVGGKMANVGEVGNRIGLPVPPGFTITALAYHRLMEHNKLQVEIDRRIQATVAERMDELFRLSADIQQLIIRSEVPEDLQKAILGAYAEVERELGPGVRVSLRSSALGEDMAGTSFAGQYRSELNVSAEHILHAYKGIVASKYSLQAMTYRLNRGIPDEYVSMSVGCMAMIHAAAGGVMYSSNPMDIRDTSIIINSVWGLPKSVVDGSVTPDLITVSRDEPLKVIDKQIRVKDRKFVCYPDEGVCRMDLTGENSALPSITDEQAVELGRMAIRLEDYYGSPQDIEWAIDIDGSIFVLQCRPLQQMESHRPAPVQSDQAPADDSVILQGGVTASPGIACGPVYVVRKDMDALRFPEGGVL